MKRTGRADPASFAAGTGNGPGAGVVGCGTGGFTSSATVGTAPLGVKERAIEEVSDSAARRIGSTASSKPLSKSPALKALEIAASTALIRSRLNADSPARLGTASTVLSPFEIRTYSPWTFTARALASTASRRGRPLSEGTVSIAALHLVLRRRASSARSALATASGENMAAPSRTPTPSEAKRTSATASRRPRSKSPFLKAFVKDVTTRSRSDFGNADSAERLGSTKTFLSAFEITTERPFNRVFSAASTASSRGALPCRDSTVVTSTCQCPSDPDCTSRSPCSAAFAASVENSFAPS